MSEREYILSVVIGVWVLYHIIMVSTSKKKNGLLLVITLIIAATFGYLLINPEQKQEYYDYFYYGTLSLFAVNMLLGNIRKHFKKDISEFDFLELEEQLEQHNELSELLRRRFISTIEILNDGISFTEENGDMFGSDRFVELTGLKDNQFSQEIYHNIIYKDDLPQYIQTKEKASKRNPVYRIDYRIEKDGNLIWLKEVGKQIIINKKITYISIVKILDIKLFPQTEIDVLNGLQGVRKMYDEMQELSRKKNPYHFVHIQLSNIPQINEKYGRDVGDLMMGEYLKKIRYNFIKDNQSLFRIGGINFGLIIKDEKKYEILVRALQGAGELLNLKMVFGGVTQTLYPNIGISESPYEGKSPDVVIEQAKKALDMSLHENSDSNYCFYDRI